MRGKPIKRPMWVNGDPIMVGRYVGTKTEWELGTLIDAKIMQVKLPDGTIIDRLSTSFLAKKPQVGTEAPEKIEQTLDPEVLKQALVNIIKEGDTQSPNSTVKRMVNIAKEALGELTI